MSAATQRTAAAASDAAGKYAGQRYVWTEHCPYSVHGRAATTVLTKYLSRDVDGKWAAAVGINLLSKETGISPVTLQKALREICGETTSGLTRIFSRAKAPIIKLNGKVINRNSKAYRYTLLISPGQQPPVQERLRLKAAVRKQRGGLSVNQEGDIAGDLRGAIAASGLPHASDQELAFQEQRIRIDTRYGVAADNFKPVDAFKAAWFRISKCNQNPCLAIRFARKPRIRR